MNIDDGVEVNPFNLSSMYVEQMYDQKVIGIGTGFTYQYKNRLFFVSNWHVLSGRHPRTKLSEHRMAAVPNKVRVHYHIENDIYTPKTRIFDLLNADTPIWLEHPVHGSSVDVAVLEISKTDSDMGLSIQDSLAIVDPFQAGKPEVGGPVFILGYPFGLSATPHFPIWKAAYIASEPEIDLDGLPKFFVDTASREGMSGSPVITYIRRGVVANLEHNGEQKTVSYYCRFAGVYSGRIGADDEMRAQLGVIWKARVIEEIIDGNTFGKL